MKSKGCELALAAVRDLREHRVPTNGEELPDFETDVLSGFVLARASAGLADSTIRNDTNHLELIRDWFGRPLWEMQPADADAYFGKVLRDAKPSTRTGRAAALTVFFQFLELRHKVELHNRHFCASQLYLGGMSLFAVQELLGHAWTGTTARYIHVHGSHVEDAWVAGQQRASDRWKGLV